MKTALVAGHTGLVGGFLLNYLLDSGKYGKIITLGRRTVDIANPKLEQRIIDFDDIQIDVHVDDVFCALGTTIKKAGSKEKFRLVDYQYPINLAFAGKKAGAKTFVLVSAQGANRKSMFFYNRVKGELEESLIKLGFEKLEILRPSLLMGDRDERRPMEALAQKFMKSAGFLFSGPLANMKGIEASRVARAMVTLANDDHKGKRLHESGVLQNY